MAGKFVQGNWLLPNNVNANKQSNYSLDFTVGKKVQLEPTSSFNFGSGDWSICWWMKLGTLPAQLYNPLIDIGDYANSGTNAFIIYIHNTRFINIYKRPSVNLGTSTITVKSLEWNFCTLVKENQTITLNIINSDNQSPEVLTTSASGNFGNSTENSFLGGQNSSGTRYYDGGLDEVNVFSRALSSSEITALYNSGTPGNPFGLSGDPIAYYKLGETAVFQNTAYSGNIFQVPNHAQTQLAWGGDTTAALSPHASVGLPVGGENLGTVHTLSYWINNNSVSLSNSKAGQWFCKESGSNMSMAGSGVSDRGIIFGNNHSNINSHMPVNGVYITYRTGGQTSTTNMQFPLGSINLLDNQTYNIIFVRNGGSVKCFINGQEITNPVGSIDSTYELIFDSINFNSYASLKTEWKGIMSNVAVWKSDRESEVSNIYNNGEPQSNYTTAPDLWYKLDDTTTSYPAQYKRAINQSLSSESYVKSYLKQPFSSGGATSQYNSIVSVLDADLNLGTSYSFSFWMALDPLKTEFSGYYNVNCYYLGTTGSNGTSFGGADGGILFQSGDGYGSSNVGINWNVYDTNGNSTGTIAFNNSSTPSYTNASDGSFHNYTFVKDGQTVSFYFDNQLVGSGTMSGELSNTILNNINGGNNLLGGQARQLRWAEWSFFANKVLSSSERATIYNSGNPGDISSVSPSLWYSYDNIDVANNKLIDKSSSSNDASTVRILNTTQNTDVFQGKYIKYIDGVQSMYNNNLSSTDLGLHNPLYSQFSTWFPAGSAVDTNFTLPAYTKYSYSFWYKKTTSTTFSGDRTIIGNMKEGSGANIDSRGTVMLKNEAIQVLTGNGSVDYLNSSFNVSSLLLDQNWHHVVFTWINGQIQLFIDGSLENTYTDSNIITGVAAEATTKLGRLNTQYSKFLTDSLIDEFAIFDRQLSNTEITSIYNNGKPTSLASHSPVQWWRLGDTGYATTTASSSTLTYPNEISGQPNGVTTASMQPSINADAPGVVAPGSSSGLVELDKKGDSPNSTSNSISYNILKTDQSVYTPKYVSQYTVDNNYSMAFDGTGYMSLGSSINIGKENTIAFWVYKTNTQSVITGEASYGSDYNIYISSTIGTYYRVGSAASWSYNVPNDAWVHLAFTRNQTALKLYVNGVSLGSNTGGSITSTTDTKFDTIGDKSNGSHDGGAAPFIGKLDEFAAWDKELTADQIKFDIYEASATANKSADFINNPNLPTPVAWYRMGD